jgi:hypothetical protein
MKQPILVGLGSGHEGRLSVDLGSIRFTLEIEDGKPGVECLTLSELKLRPPNAAGLVAGIVAEAIGSRSTNPH